MGALVFGYGMAGFGYIVTATFLPVIARQALPGSIWLDLFWPLFGAAVAAGSLLTLWVPLRWDRRHLLVGCYALQAMGVMLGVWWPSLTGFALGSLLLGLPFTAITLFGLQEARRLSPERSAVLISLMTAAYGLGQIAGPAMVSVLLVRSASAAQGLVQSLQIAAGSLVLGLAVFALMAWARPMPAARSRTSP
jgi:predicted MFS family arabinose efflux permease